MDAPVSNKVSLLAQVLREEQRLLGMTQIFVNNNVLKRKYEDKLSTLRQERAKLLKPEYWQQDNE